MSSLREIAEINNLYQGLNLIGSPTTEILVSSVETAGWGICSLAKDPWFSRIKGKPTPTDPEYYSARRDNHLYVNWVDAIDPKFFRIEELDTIFNFIDEMMHKGTPILLHCNMNESRSPSVAMLYLASIGILPRKYNEAVSAFCIMYPTYRPNIGIKEFIKANWNDYAEI